MTTAVQARMPAQVAPVFVEWAGEGLVWLPEKGVGYYPVSDSPYDDAYFHKYVEYADTALGRELTRLRLEMVRRHIGDGPRLIDVGIGAGQFIEARGLETYGYDVNARSVAWLQERGLFRDPYRRAFPAATFWDSLEHIHDIDKILENIAGWVFCALPVFRDAQHVLSSKHFRTDEHCWYFTARGLKAFMAAHGFDLMETNDAETAAGREDIHSFAFRRVE